MRIGNQMKILSYGEFTKYLIQGKDMVSKVRLPGGEHRIHLLSFVLLRKDAMMLCLIPSCLKSLGPWKLFGLCCT